MAGSRTILVTGANRGIGLAIIQALASHPETKDDVLLIGCRELQKGQSAIDEIKRLVPTATIHLIKIEVTSDASIRAAVAKIKSEHQGLDILINNAGFAMLASAQDHSDVREAFSKTYDTNVTSVAMTMSLFIPILRSQGVTNNAKIINISSARGSMTRSATGQLPPTTSAAYSISKTALNALTIEMSRQEEHAFIEFQLACPGHCKTQFNGFRGLRDPLEGANVVVELVIGKRRPLAAWETQGSSHELLQVPW